MKLSEFVADTLVEVMRGVQTAQAQWSETGNKGFINPVWGGYDQGPKNIREVQFDVAVTATEEATGTGKAGIKVLGIAELGADGERSRSTSSVSRIAFSIPIAPPILYVEMPEAHADELGPEDMPPPVL
jgi:hypothetical protein